MFRNLANRLLQGMLVLFVLYTVTFFLIKALPYGPFQSDKAIPAHVKEKINAYYGLDRPVWEQYTRQLTHLAKGDPGLSLHLEGRPVSEIITQAFPISFHLGIIAMTLAIAVGLPAGMLAAARKNTPVDYFTMIFAMAGICLPALVTGPLLAEVFARQYNLVPAIGWNARNPQTWILPAITLGAVYAAYLSRLTRAGMLDTLSQDFVRTARAKGASGQRILILHCMRGGLIPAAAFIGPAFAGIISGSVVVETIFQVPGLGSHFVKAIETSDAPLILGIVLLYGVLITLGNLASDLLGFWLNPKLRKSN
jgi:oligopeptide transport system permease protein